MNYYYNPVHILQEQISMLVAQILKINQPKIENLSLLFQVLSVQNVEELQKRITSILNHAVITSTLKQWHINYDDLPQLATQSGTKERIDNNPINLTPNLIEQVLQSIY